MDGLKKAQKAFTRAYITYEGHINWEFQYSKNLEKSKKVVDRNIEAVRTTARAFEELCGNELELLEKKMDEIKGLRHYLQEMRYFPKNLYSFGLRETFPEIEKGTDAYGDKYLDRKYRVK